MKPARRHSACCQMAHRDIASDACRGLGTPAARGYTERPNELQETPRMINKIVQTMADAMAGIKDGSVVLLGGFGSVGQPNALIDGLIEQGATGLTVACNNAGAGHVGLARLMELGRVRRIICSFPR